MNRIRILRSLPILCLTLLLSISVTDAQHLSLKQVTFSDSTHDGYPYWSPDGEYIIYSAGSRDHVYTMRIPSEGGAPEVVTDVFAHHATWSPDGAYIAFDGYMGSLIQLVSSTGGTPVRIVPESIPVVHSGYPNWSPGGGRIAFMSGGDVWILEL
ncbi:MAG: PD40 domain-containing protein, partial [Bacteroidales bacterium]